jgi:hypothetical protein
MRYQTVSRLTPVLSRSLRQALDDARRHLTATRQCDLIDQTFPTNRPATPSHPKKNGPRRGLYADLFELRAQYYC